MRARLSRLILVGAMALSLSGIAAAPANASTCQVREPLHELVCDTIVDPVMAALCKVKICFG